MIKVLLALVLLVVSAGVGYLYGRRYGDVRAYEIGMEQGFNAGIETAYTAYQSGGEDAVQRLIPEDPPNDR